MAADRITTVEADLHELQGRVAQLLGRIQVLEARPAAAPTADASAAAVAASDPGWSWQQHSGALRRLATISFILAFALVLRTLTDSGVVDQTLGVWLGVAYAVCLLGVGWRRFAVDRAGKRVFSICGALLLCSLVLETHTRFACLPAPEAHALLVVALLASSGLGMRYGSAIVAELGVLAAATAAIALGFPLPEFPITAATLLLAIACAVLAPRRRVPWLHWTASMLLLFFWLLWAAKLHAGLTRDATVGDELRLPWFVPELAATFAVLLAIAGWMAARRAGLFARTLPAANVALACAAAGAVVVPWSGAERWLGATALLLAGLHTLLAARFARSTTLHPATAPAFALAALVAFVPGILLSTGSPDASLAAMSLACLGAAAASARLRSGGLRATAVALQVALPIVAVTGGLFAAPSDHPWLAAGLGSALAALAAVHLRWTRVVPPPAGTLYARLSPTDAPAQAMFWTSLAALFCTLRIVVHHVLAALPVDVDNAFAAAQSVLLNGIAIAMMVAAGPLRERRMLGRAIVVAALGGIRVFASDLLTLRGVPLVLSVVSFGVAAAVGSFVLSRWPRESPAAA